MTRRSRPVLLAALAALITPVVGVAASAPAAAGTHSTVDRAPLVSGRFLHAGKHGIELVDEDGRRRHTVVRDNSQVALYEVHPATGTFLWSSTEKKNGASSLVFHVSNVYGVELGVFQVPDKKNTPPASTPTISADGYTAYYAQPGQGGEGATSLMRLQIGIADETPTVVRKLDSSTTTAVRLSPDGELLAVSLSGYRTAEPQLHVVAVDGSSDRVLPVAAGSHVLSGTSPWSPDSTRVAVQMRQDSGPAAGTLYSVQVSDLSATPVGTGLGLLYDWSPEAGRSSAESAGTSWAAMPRRECRRSTP